MSRDSWTEATPPAKRSKVGMIVAGSLLYILGVISAPLYSLDEWSIARLKDTSSPPESVRFAGDVLFALSIDRDASYVVEEVKREPDHPSSEFARLSSVSPMNELVDEETPPPPLFMQRAPLPVTKNMRGVSRVEERIDLDTNGQMARLDRVESPMIKGVTRQNDLGISDTILNADLVEKTLVGEGKRLGEENMNRLDEDDQMSEHLGKLNVKEVNSQRILKSNKSERATRSTTDHQVQRNPIETLPVGDQKITNIDTQNDHQINAKASDKKANIETDTLRLVEHGPFTLQLRSFRDPREVSDFIAQLKDRGFKIPTRVVQTMFKGRKYHRVRAGYFATRSDAKLALNHFIKQFGTNDKPFIASTEKDTH